jgi:hypothetical protein
MIYPMEKKSIKSDILQNVYKKKLLFWALVPFVYLWPFYFRYHGKARPYLLGNAGRQFHKESKEKSNLK